MKREKREEKDTSWMEDQHTVLDPLVEGELVASFDGGGTGIENIDSGDGRRKMRIERYASLMEEQKVRCAKARKNHHHRKAAAESSITAKCAYDIRIGIRTNPVQHDGIKFAVIA
ncbi:hypothetical protein GQ55_7G005500 [Panicum hallii var. hallii]|uniref:Uncharacterized protein n=1 Tax=Panicum hallii var. hallii TaxID=1504633 RepID=A0A2T7CRK4_9POAL|nr:hypothetical protein GQ55_7G005500 [Panicum hallii var. hallii]